MAEHSPAFQQFLESLSSSHADRRFADELDVTALALLGPNERRQAERLLLKRLEQDPKDTRVADALARIQSTKAIPELRRVLPQLSGSNAVRTAMALARLEPTYDPTELLLDALKTGNFVTRGLAADALALSSRAEARDGLLEALVDDDFSVRVMALDALLEVSRLKPYKEHEHGLLRTIGMRLLSDYESVVQEAAGEMRRIIDAIDQGHSPQDLHLDEHPSEQRELIEQVMTSLRSKRTEPPWERDLNLDALGQLSGLGRRFFECVLLAELHEGDPRIPRALAAMRSLRAVDPLREALEKTDGSMRVEVARALEVITGDGTGRQVLAEMAEEGSEAAGQALEGLSAKTPRSEGPHS